MKITFICAVFPPEPEPAGVMARQVAEKLSADGHDVSMIVPVPNRPTGRVYEGFQGRSRRQEADPGGFTIVRCAHWLIGRRRRFADRILENITFGISSAWAAWRRGRPDVMIVETWPLFATSFCALLARLWRIPYLYYVQDVYPEAAEQAGYLRAGSRVARFLRRWDARLCRMSARVIAISPSMRTLLQESRNLSETQVAVIPNWQDAADFPLHKGTGSWRAEMAIPSTAFVVMFAGTLGHVSGAEILVDVADLLQSHKDIVIVCIGDGIHKQAMRERAEALGLDNFRFFPFQPRTRVAEVLSSADLMLLTMQQNSVDSSVPSKLISYMAAGRAVLCSADGASTSATIVRESGAGIVVPAGDPPSIAEEIWNLYNHRPQVERMGQRARAYFEEHMTLDRAYQQISKLLWESTGVETVTPFASNIQRNSRFSPPEY